MSSRTVLIDSNIFIYAINSSSPKHRRAQSFLQDNIGSLAVAHQNILESLRVLTHSKFQAAMFPADALSAINAITEHCRLIVPGYEALESTLALIKKYRLSGDKIFDAYLCATALSAGLTVIATDNTKDFLQFKEINTINPFK